MCALQEHERVMRGSCWTNNFTCGAMGVAADDRLMIAGPTIDGLAHAERICVRNLAFLARDKVIVKAPLRHVIPAC